MTPMLSVVDLVKHYPTPGGKSVLVLDGVSFSLARGEIFGIVGESGCGKSTLARTLMRLATASSGRILYEGEDVMAARGRALKRLRGEIQMVFQDPFGSLNPRHTIERIIGEPLVVHNRPGRAARVRELLDLIGLPQSAASRLPHQFSGGQRQRIAIARALALSPKIIIADEAVSALDVSIQSQIINLLAQLRRDLGLAIIFISHDLSVVRHLSDRIGVMYFGRFVEQASAADLFAAPRHPYTRALISAVPKLPGAAGGPCGKRIVLSGDVPNLAHRPGGCLFHPRCYIARDRCQKDVPPLAATRPDKPDWLSACHYADEIDGLVAETALANR